MKGIQIPNSQRSHVIDEPQQIILPSPNKRKKLYIGVFLTVVLLIVLSMHLASRKYQAHSSPFSQQANQHKKEGMIEIPHDTSCYTQGLSFINSTHILESCGLYKESFFHILKYDRRENSTQIKEVWKSQIFDNQYFLQGSTLFPKNNLIYILTWQEKVVFRYEADTLKEKDRLSWNSQGWGLTHNNSHLIVSDGSDKIYITDENMQIVETIKVKDHQGNAQKKINQLEWIKEGNNQYVLANIYQTKFIVKISLRTGQIVQKKSFDDIVKKERDEKHFEVLNGIAYNAKDNNYLLTGKKWGSFYQFQHI